MPYSGSAQTVRFQNRTVLDASSRMRQKASDDERKDLRAIDSFARVEAEKIGELSRQDEILKANDALKLKQLAQFSEGLNKAIQAVPTIMKIQEQNKRKEETENYFGTSSEVINPTAKKENEEVVTELGRQAQASTVKQSKVTEPMPAETGNRIMSANPQRTYVNSVLTLREMANGYPTHLIAELDSNETWIQLEGGRPFQIKDASTAEERILAAKEIGYQYLQGIDSPLKQQLINKHLIDKMITAQEQELKNRAALSIKDGYNQTINAWEAKLSLAWDEKAPDFDPEAIIEGSWAEVGKAYKGLHKDGTASQRFRQALMKSAALYLTTTTDKNAARERIQNAFNNARIPDHPLATKENQTLPTIFPDEFGSEVLFKQMRKIENEEFQAQQTWELSQAKTFIATANQQLREHIDGGGSVATFRHEDGSGWFEGLGNLRSSFPLATATINQAIAAPTDYQGYTDSIKTLSDLSNYWGGSIPLEETKNLNQQAVRDYVENNNIQIVAKPLGHGTPKEAEQFWKDNTKWFRKLVQGEALTPDENWDGAASLWMRQNQSKLVERARGLQSTNPGMGDMEALRAAWLGHGDQPGLKHELRADFSGKGPLGESADGFHNGTSFPNIKASMAQQTTSKHERFEIQTQVLNLRNNTNDLSTPLSLQKKIFKNPIHLELTKYGDIHPLVKQMARESGENPIDYLNNQRSLQQPPLDELPPFEEALQVQKLFSNNEELSQYIKKMGYYPKNSRGIAQSVNRLLKKIGKPDPNIIVQALGKQHEGQTNLYGIPYSQLVSMKPLLTKKGIAIPSKSEYEQNPSLQKQVALAYSTDLLDRIYSEMATTPIEVPTISNTLPSIKQRISDLKANRPGEYRTDQSFLHVAEQSDEFKAWDTEVKKLQNIETVLNGFENPNVVFGTNIKASTPATVALKNVIGKDRYDAIIAKIGQPPNFLVEGNVKALSDYKEKFIAEIRALPEFATELPDTESTEYQQTQTQPITYMFGNPKTMPSVVLRRFFSAYHGGWDYRGQWADEADTNFRGKPRNSSLDYGTSAIYNYLLMSRGEK